MGADPRALVTESAGLVYTVATGRLFCHFDTFHHFAEELMGRPIYTHEFASEALWEALRSALEARLRQNLEIILPVPL